MFQSCASLQSISLPANTLVIDFANMFNTCQSLQKITGLNGNSTVSTSNYSNIFSGCSSLGSIGATNMKFTHSIASAKFSATELNAYYTALPTVAAGTLTVTGNWGTATDSPAIAIAKGWTVVG
jgi:hypothetical protein